MLSGKQSKQEQEYQIPYHYLFERKLHRGIHYFSYLDIVIALLKYYKNKKILDVGCGEGRGTFEISKTCKNIEGVDYSKRAIAFAQAFAPSIKFNVIDFTKSILMEQKFDAAISIEVFEHIPPEKLKVFVSNISKVVKKGGIFVLTTPTPNTQISKKHYQHFTEEKLDKVLNRLFKKRKVIYHSNKYWNILFIILRGFLFSRYHSINFKFLNYFLYKFYKLFVERANKANGGRIIYLCEKK